MTIRTGPMRSGRLNRLITIQHQASNPNGTRGWQDLFVKVPAEALPLTGGEAVHELGPVNVQAIQLTIRYRPGVTTQMRVVFRNRILEIVSIVNVEENDVELLLMCREAPKPG